MYSDSFRENRDSLAEGSFGNRRFSHGSEDDGDAQFKNERKWSGYSVGNEEQNDRQTFNRDEPIATYLHKDFVEEMAQQKLKEKLKQRQRRRCYQGVIFAMAFIINFLNRLRNQYILDWYQCREDNSATTE